MEVPITVEPTDFNSAPPLPPTSSQRKRRKSKPTRFEINAEEQLPLSIVASDPPVQVLSVQPEKSPAKAAKTAVPFSAAMLRAMNFQLTLGNEFPSCIKMMVKSQVNVGFWMGLPLHFCKTFLPTEEVTFVLEVENGDKYEVKYIAYKFGLSAGWKKFVSGCHLAEGDVLIFQLVETAKFKIYIFKADSSEGNGALSLLDLEEHTEEVTPILVTPSPKPKTKKKKRPESLSLTVAKKKHKKSAVSSKSVPPPQVNYQLTEQSGNNSEDVGSEVLEGFTSSNTNGSFEEIKTFEDFRIMFKGKCIDHELTGDVRIGYYKLCLCKKQFLHEGIGGSPNCKLVAGMIDEIVSIANEIKNCKITTTVEEFETWDNSLKSFEIWGMKVGFLRDRIHKQKTIVFKSEGASDIKKYAEAVNKHKQVEDEIKKVAAKLKELKVTAKKYESVSGCLKEKADKYENKFKEAVDAPW